MANPFRFKYNGRTWIIRYKTVNNCFFHATYSKGHKFLCFDKQAVFRRRCWSNFLWYFLKREMPTPLAEVLQKCFFVNPKYADKSVENKEWVKSYLEDIVQEEYRVSFEELVILATLDNMKFVVFKDEEKEPHIIEPDQEILGNFPLRSKNNLREVVLYLYNNEFSKLDSESDTLTTIDVGAETKSQNINLPKDLPPQGDRFLKTPIVGVQSRLYKIHLLTIFLLNAVHRDINFRLSTDNEKAGYFDDLVLEMVPTNEVILLQTKYKARDQQSTKREINLLNYYELYLNIKHNFNIKRVILCTNTCLEDKEILAHKNKLKEDSLLYFKDTNSSCYSFIKYKKNFVRKLKHMYHKDEKEKHKDLLNDEDITEFLEQFQYVSEYPSGVTLENILDNLPYQLNMCQPSESRNLSKFLQSKVMEWHDNPLGIYLTQDHVKTFLCEYRSDVFCKRIQNFQVFFKQNRLNLDKKRRILHINSRQDVLFSVIKTYQALQEEGIPALFINSVDGMKVFDDMFNTFKNGDFHYLVIVYFDQAKVIEINDFHNKLIAILKRDGNKRFIVLTNKRHRFYGPERIMALYKTENDYVSFNDLTESSQEGVLQKVLKFYRTTL